MQHSEFYKNYVLLTGNNNEVREAAKKSSSLNGRANKRRRGVKGRAIKEKIFFGTFLFQRSNFPTAIKLEGGVSKKKLSVAGMRGVFPLSAQLKYGFNH